MKKILSIFRNIALLLFLATTLYNCKLTEKVHPTAVLPEPTPQQIDAHTAIKKAGGYVEIRVLPDSVAQDQSFLNWYVEQIFIQPCDTNTTTFSSNSEMSGGAKFTQTTYNFTPKKIPGGFRIFAVEYIKPEPIGPLYASVGANEYKKDITPVLDFFIGSVTYQPGDVVTVPFGPVSVTKTRDGCCPAPEMLYTTDQIRIYTPPVKKEKEDTEISKPHWGEPKM